MKKKILSIIILFAFIIIAIFNKSTSIEPTDNLNIHFIDVGQADCILLQLPNNEICLIDAGNRGDKDLIINYLNKQNVKKIDYLILTHPHEDHIGSAPDVISKFEIGKIYIPDREMDTQIFKQTINAIQNTKATVIKTRGGEKIITDTNLKFEVLAPNTMYYSELNEYSIVTKLTYNDTSFLFTGDAESVSELEMIRAGYALDCDLLKVGHHGGRTSTSKDFLNAVTPKYAVIMSETGNDYGHPHKETLDRLNLVGSKIYRTDSSGTIVVSSDGQSININKEEYSPSVSQNTINESIDNDVNGANNTNTSSETTEKDIANYIGNTNTKKFHDLSCSSAKSIKVVNKIDFRDRASAISQNFVPCGICKP